MNYLVFAKGVDPTRNLALEEHLTRTVGPDDVVLYLWQNDRTVVVGLNQNAWRECLVDSIHRDGGHLVRRMTGGGTVYHDMGNLNFSFVAGSNVYDLDKQFDTITRAVLDEGVTVTVSGRNDITVDGKKFSGNAFRHTRDYHLHHGTLLVDSDLTALTGYLTVSKLKLTSKGIQSVRSRVTNLVDHNPMITVSSLRDAIVDSFYTAYGSFTVLDIDESEYADLICKYSSYDFRLGSNPSFTAVIESKYSYGILSINLTVKNGLTEAEVYTDMLDTEFPNVLRDALTGIRFTSDSIVLALKSLKDGRADEIVPIVNEQFDV